MNTKRANKGYRINKYREQGYQHIYITIILPDNGNIAEMNETGLQIIWQTDNERSPVSDERKSWYACQVVLKVHEKEELATLTKLANKLEFTFGTFPELVIEQLEALGYVRMVYDARVHSHMPITEIADVSYSGYYAHNYSLPRVQVYATDEKSARLELLAYYKANLSKEDKRYLEYWLSDGMPVDIYDTSARMPTWEELDKLLTIVW